MDLLSPEVFVQDQCQLGECPIWFAQRLWWVDIEGGVLHSVDDAGHNKRTFQLHQPIGCAAPVDENQFIVALEHGLHLLNLLTGEIRPIAILDQPDPDNRFNDGKCDPTGRLLAGTLNRRGREQQGALYSFGRDRKLRVLLKNVGNSNGLAWSADGTTLYYIDTPTFEVKAFDYNLADGEISNPRVAVRIPQELGYPDGMTIDLEGNLWIAHWNGYAVRKWSPYTGELLATVSLPCSRPTSCCFGGREMNQLFITTARTGLCDNELTLQPSAGSIFVCSPDVRGNEVNICAYQDS